VVEWWNWKPRKKIRNQKNKNWVEKIIYDKLQFKNYIENINFLYKRDKNENMRSKRTET